MIESFAELYRKQPILVGTGLVHVVLALLMLAGLIVDSRTVLGINPWIKPIKFATSIALYLFSIALFISYLPNQSRLLWWTGLIIAATMVIEIALISLQAARGTTSHFNLSTPLDSTIFSVMGTAIAVNSIMVAFVLVQFFMQEIEITPSFLWGIRLGIVVFLLGSVQGMLMVSRMSHSVGIADGGPGLPFVNWSTIAGDLRVSHFVGLHGLQLLPLVGFLASNGNKPDDCTQMSMVWVFGAAGLMVGVMGWTLLQAMAGRPLISTGR